MKNLSKHMGNCWEWLGNGWGISNLCAPSRGIPGRAPFCSFTLRFFETNWCFSPIFMALVTTMRTFNPPNAPNTNDFANTPNVTNTPNTNMFAPCVGTNTKRTRTPRTNNKRHEALHNVTGCYIMLHHVT